MYTVSWSGTNSQVRNLVKLPFFPAWHHRFSGFIIGHKQNFMPLASAVNHSIFSNIGHVTRAEIKQNFTKFPQLYHKISYFSNHCQRNFTHTPRYSGTSLDLPLAFGEILPPPHKIPYISKICKTPFAVNIQAIIYSTKCAHFWYIFKLTIYIHIKVHVCKIHVSRL